MLSSRQRTKCTERLCTWYAESLTFAGHFQNLFWKGQPVEDAVNMSNNMWISHNIGGSRTWTIKLICLFNIMRSIAKVTNNSVHGVCYVRASFNRAEIATFHSQPTAPSLVHSTQVWYRKLSWSTQNSRDVNSCRLIAGRSSSAFLLMFLWIPSDFRSCLRARNSTLHSIRRHSTRPIIQSRRITFSTGSFITTD